MRIVALATSLALLAGPGNAATDVGTLDFQGDSILAPITFHTSFASTLDVPGGLTFDIASGQHGPVRLELLDGKNIVLAAGAIAGASAIGALPLSILSDALASGNHRFAIAALTNQGEAGGIFYKLTLTPLPGAIMLFGSGVVALWAVGRRRLSS